MIVLNADKKSSYFQNPDTVEVTVKGSKVEICIVAHSEKYVFVSCYADCDEAEDAADEICDQLKDYWEWQSNLIEIEICEKGVMSYEKY